MSLTFHVKGDEANSDQVHVSLTRGKRRETCFTRAELCALIYTLSIDCDVLSQIGAGCSISIEINVDKGTGRQGSPKGGLSHVLINGLRPLTLTKEEFFQIIRSPRLAQRALYWTRRGKPYLKIFREGGRGVSLLIDTRSVEVFYHNLLAGTNIPPSMPCEAQKD